MTIRDQLAEEIGDLICEMLDLSEDPDISPALKSNLLLAMSHLGFAQDVITVDDSGLTAADISGEVDHV